MLPILQTTQNDLLRFYARAELHWARHLGEETQLDFGTAICNPELAAVHDANRIMDAFLPPDKSPEEIIAKADALFVSRNCRCRQWTLSGSADSAQVQALESELTAQNFRREMCNVMRLGSGPMELPQSRDDVQILPARASFRHARQIAEESAQFRGVPQLADAAMLHLDDPQWDALLAIKDGAAIGRAGVLSVGEIGLVENVFVAPPFRRQGIATMLMLRAIEICQRSLFRHVLLGVAAGNASAISLYQKLGFIKVADAPTFISA